MAPDRTGPAPSYTWRPTVWLRVLGSAAGGGSPQWNCGCPVCAAVRSGAAPVRTQSSVAVSGDRRSWFLINASPDVRTQIEASPALHPHAGRATPVFDFSTIAKGGWPQLMRMTRDGRRLFITMNVAGRVAMLDTSDPQHPALLSVLDLGIGSGPHYLALTRDERQGQEEADADDRSDEQRRCLQMRGQKRGHREEPEEEVVGPGKGVHDGGVGEALRPEGPEIGRAGHHGQDDRAPEDEVAREGHGHEGHAVLVDERVVLLHVGLPADEPARHRPLVDPELDDHEQVNAEKADQGAGNDEDVKRKEAGQGCPGDDGTAQHHLHDLRSEDGRAAGDGRSDPEAPIGVLVEAQDLSGEGQSQRAQEQEDSDDPGQLARELVGAEQHDLDHVEEDDRHHEVRAPAVHGAEVPAERLLVVEGLEALEGLVRRGHVDEGETDAGDDLEHEKNHARGPEDVPPARGATGHGVGRGFVDGRAHLEALVQPRPDRADHAHGLRPPRRLVQ